MIHHESHLQQACVKWFRLQYPKYRNLLFAIPNGGRRGKTEAGIMKGEGVLAGVPDLMLALPTRHRHGLFIEMKSKHGTVSKNQREIISGLRNVGYSVEVCYNFDQFMTKVNDYLTGL